MKEAAIKAHVLSGLGSTTELNWMPTTVAPDFTIEESATSNDPSSPSIEPTHLSDEFSLLDTDNLEAEDDLDDNGDALRDEDIIRDASAVVRWQVPVRIILSVCSMV